MRTVFLSIVSLSFGIIPLLLLLFVLRKQIKKRFGAGWVRLIWIAVLLRLPVSYTHLKSKYQQNTTGAA